MAGINWPGLMQWSTQYHDGTAPSEFNVMSDADKKFLTDAMEAAFADIEDPNQVFLEAINKFKEAERTDATMMTALEIIDRVCDDPDVSRNAEKLGGVQPILDVSVDTTVNPEIRSRSLEIFALLLSNNPNIQEAAMEKDALQKLMARFRESAIGSDARLKTIRTIVALVRNVDAFESLFVNEYGVGDLADCLSSKEEPRVREKAASCAQGLAHNGRLNEAHIAQLAVAVARLLQDVSTEEVSIQYRETMASCASALLEAGDAVPSWRQTLKEATVTRLVKLKQLKDPDTEQEVGSLQVCMTALQ